MSVWPDHDRFPYKLPGQIFLNKKYYCSMCGLEILGFKDRLSAKEFSITGLCQQCQGVRRATQELNDD